VLIAPSREEDRKKRLVTGLAINKYFGRGKQAFVERADLVGQLGTKGENEVLLGGASKKKGKGTSCNMDMRVGGKQGGTLQSLLLQITRIAASTRACP